MRIITFFVSALLFVACAANCMADDAADLAKASIAIAAAMPSAPAPVQPVQPTPALPNSGSCANGQCTVGGGCANGQCTVGEQSSGQCANGQCGGRSARRGFFGWRR